MNRSLAKFLVVTVFGCGIAGCITHEETVYKDVERTRVEFENDTAGRLFYETLSKGQPRQQRGESKTEVAIPFVFSDKRRVVSGQNAAFNEAVLVCDTNRDGRITEVEARIFAQQKSAR